MAGYIGSKANVSQIDGYVKSEVDTLLGQELNLSGGSMTGHLNFGDNIKIQSGAGTDLQIYHDASNSYIKDAGTGSLRLSATTIELMKVDTSELMASFAQDGAVTLYYDNAAKLATASGGITITGNASFADNGKAIFGDGSDLQIYHDGSNSYIKDAGTGSLRLRGTDLRLESSTLAHNFIVCTEGGGVTAYHNDSAKLSTTSTGINVTGVITTDGLTTSANINFGDSDKAIFGAGSDLQIYHSGTHNYIQDSGTGNLYLGGSDLIWLGSGDLQEAYATFNDDGAVTLRHDNSIKFATTSTGIDVTGNATFADNGKAIFGAGSDLQIYHTGSASYIDDAGDGNLFIRANDFRLGKYTGEFYLKGNSDGNVELYYDNALKLATTSTGISVTGNATFSDNGKAIFGAGSDLQIYHDGANSYVADAGDGDLILRGSTGIKLQSASGALEYLSTSSSTGAVELKLSGATKLATTSTGIDVTGLVTADPESGNFSSTYNNYDGVGLFIKGNGTSGNGNYGPALVFGSCDSDTANQDHKHSAISVVQTDTDPNQTGLAFWTHPSVTSTDALVEAMRIDSSGNVGIGTSSPSEKLHVQGDGADVLLTDAAGGQTAKLGATGSNNGILELNNSSHTSTVVLNTSGDSYLNGGNVGIGTASPSSYNSKADDLVVATSSDTGISVISGTSSEGALVFADGTTGGSPLMGRIRYNHSSNEMDFRVNNDQVMTIDSSGNVGFGTSDPDCMLHLSGGNEEAKIKFQVGTANADKFKIYASTAGRLYVNSDNGSTGVYLTHNGTSWTSNSDETLKENITSLGTVGDKLKNYRTSYFTWKADTETPPKRNIGFIAQDWETDFPEVLTKKEGEPMGMQYTETIPILLKYIQELEARITALEA